MKIAVLTSNHFRHIYFANRLAEDLDVVLVATEGKSFNPQSNAKNHEEDVIIAKHLELRENEEIKTFTEQSFLARNILSILPGELNDAKTIAHLIDSGAEYLCVFGTGLLKKDLVNAFNGRIINMHLGLSPFYRGSGTNFFPVYNNEPEYCGVTIHYLDLGIDSGEIIARGRAKIYNADNIHSLGNRIIKVGTSLMIETMKGLEKGEIKSAMKQNLSDGKTYFRKDFNANTVEVAYENIANGLFSKYEQAQYEKLKEVNLYDPQ